MVAMKCPHCKKVVEIKILKAKKSTSSVAMKTVAAGSKNLNVKIGGLGGGGFGKH